MDGHGVRSQRGAGLGRAQIEALRSRPVVSQTRHFALHQGDPTGSAPVLSTAHAPSRPGSVNNQARLEAREGLGIVVPKRFARRAVTRNLIRRQAREAARRWALTDGCWLVRLRGAFDLRAYPSAASEALRAQVRAELDELMRRACGMRTTA